MDPQPQAALEAKQRLSEEPFATVGETIRALGARVDAQGCDIRVNEAALANRPTGSRRNSPSVSEPLGCMTHDKVLSVLPCIVEANRPM